MPGRFGFLNTWLKLLSPADPSVMPSGVMFWNDVWTIVTLGRGHVRHQGLLTAAWAAGGGPGRYPGRRVVLRPGSAAAAGRLLDRAQDLRRVAGDGLADLGLDHVLDRRPVRQRRVVDRVGDVTEERGERRVLRHRGRRALRGGQQVVFVVELQLPLVLVDEVQELLDRGLVAGAARLERHDVIVDAQRVAQRSGFARHVGRPVVRGLEHAGLLDDRDDGGGAEHHADLALGELGPDRLAVGAARVGLGVTRGRHLLHEVQGGDVLRAVYVVLPAGAQVAAAVAEEPQQQLGLRLLAAERHAVADVALGLDLGRVGLKFGPGLRRGGDAGRREDLLVVVHGPGAGRERDPVVDALVLAVLEELGDQVAGPARGQHVGHRVDEAGLGIRR